MNKLFIFLATAILFAIVAAPAFASGESNCQPIYGGGQTCESKVKFTINKLVQAPNKGGSYVENLTINDARYQAGSEINFKITVTNSGNTDITNLNVVDSFPQYLTFVSGVGNSSKGASQIDFVIGKIAAGQTLEYIVTAKAADAASLPKNQAITCVVNKVKATAADGSTANDQSQACIEKSIITPAPEIMPKPMVKNIPATGPATNILMGLLGAGSLGAFLRRKSS